MENKTEKKRIWELDFFRGIALLLMIYYHIIFDLREYYNFPISYTSPINALTGKLAGSLFIFISGISCSLSRNNFKRGLRIFALALCISIISYLYNPSYVILFGILHFLAVSIMLQPLFIKFSKYLLIALGFIILALGPFIPIVNDQLWFLFPIGIISQNFASSDYYSLVPWLGLFLIGLGIGKKVYSDKKSLFIIPLRENVINQAGKHTLIVYLVHQPLILAILALIYSL